MLHLIPKLLRLFTWLIISGSYQRAHHKHSTALIGVGEPSLVGVHEELGTLSITGYTKTLCLSYIASIDDHCSGLRER